MGATQSERAIYSNPTNGQCAIPPDVGVVMGWREARADNAREHHLVDSIDSRSDLAQLLDEVACYLRRFVLLSDFQLHVIALWVLHTHAFGAAETTPYLDIGSAEKESGKSRLLEVLRDLVARPWFTSSATIAILSRKIDAEMPTLLLDETDAAFKGNRDYAQELRGILDSGYRRGGKRSICEQNAKSFGHQDFNTFCPKAIAGIGTLPDTVGGRSIRIEMRRRRPDEYVEKRRERDTLPQA